jgi:uncharacterized membrane protein
MGLAVGALGETALGLAGAGLWWSVSVAASLAGFGTGLLSHGAYRRRLGGGALGACLAAGLVAHTVAWVVVCPALDMLLYREAFDNLIRRGLFTALANILTADVAGTLLLAFLGRRLPWRPPAHRPFAP